MFARPDQKRWKAYSNATVSELYFFSLDEKSDTTIRFLSAKVGEGDADQVFDKMVQNDLSLLEATSLAPVSEAYLPTSSEREKRKEKILKATIGDQPMIFRYLASAVGNELKVIAYLRPASANDQYGDEMTRFIDSLARLAIIPKGTWALALPELTSNDGLAKAPLYLMKYVAQREKKQKGEVAAQAELAAEAKTRREALLAFSGIDHSNDSPEIKAAWRQLAAIVTFSYSSNGFKTREPMEEQLFMPIQNFKRTPVNADQMSQDILIHLDLLVDSPDISLSVTAEQARELFRSRRQLALGNNSFGNTPDSSLQVVPGLLAQALQYASARSRDEMRAREALDRAYPNGGAYLADVPFSAESEEQLSSLIDSASHVVSDARERAHTSGLLNYADMAYSDHMSALWSRSIWPVLRAHAGKVAKENLIGVEPVWKKNPLDPTLRLDNLVLKNVSGRSLKNVGISLLMGNTFTEASFQYYYFNELKPGEAKQILSNPRWDARILEYSPTVLVKIAVVSDEVSAGQDTVTLESPQPDLQAAARRSDFKRYDAQYTSSGLALGALVSQMDLGLLQTSRRSHLLRQAVRANRIYSFVWADKNGVRKTWILHFTDKVPNAQAVATEITDLDINPTFATQKREWKGQFEVDANGDEVVNMEDGWTLTLSSSEQLQIRGAGGLFLDKTVPLLRVFPSRLRSSKSQPTQSAQISAAPPTPLPNMSSVTEAPLPLKTQPESKVSASSNVISPPSAPKPPLTTKFSNTVWKDSSTNATLRFLESGYFELVGVNNVTKGQWLRKSPLEVVLTSGNRVTTYNRSEDGRELIEKVVTEAGVPQPASGVKWTIESSR